MTEESYTDDVDVSQLEQRIDELEATIRKMLPSRREALGMGVAGLAGASLMSGTASAGSAQVGTIGDSNNLVDIEAEDVNISDTINGANVSGAAAGEALTSDGSGGLTFAAGGGFPSNFSYIDESSNRSFDTVFTNNSGKALFVFTEGLITGVTNRMELRFRVNGVTIAEEDFPLNTGNFSSFAKISINGFVPDGSTYEIVATNLSVSNWFEVEL